LWLGRPAVPIARARRFVVESGSARGSRTRLVHLDTITRKDAAADFFGEENVPREAITMGVGQRRPRISVDVSTRRTSTSRRGRSWNRENPSRLAWMVASSSVPVAR